VCCAILLTACASSPQTPLPAEDIPEPTVTRERERLPEEYLSCAGAPAVPEEPNRLQLSVYINELFEAWQDCYGTVLEIRRWSEERAVEEQAVEDRAFEE